MDHDQAGDRLAACKQWLKRNKDVGTKRQKDIIKILTWLDAVSYDFKKLFMLHQEDINKLFKNKEFPWVPNSYELIRVDKWLKSKLTHQRT